MSLKLSRPTHSSSFRSYSSPKALATRFATWAFQAEELVVISDNGMHYTAWTFQGLVLHGLPTRLNLRSAIWASPPAYPWKLSGNPFFEMTLKFSLCTPVRSDKTQRTLKVSGL